LQGDVNVGSLILNTGMVPCVCS